MLVNAAAKNLIPVIWPTWALNGLFRLDISPGNINNRLDGNTEFGSYVKENKIIVVKSY